MLRNFRLSRPRTSRDYKQKVSTSCKEYTHICNTNISATYTIGARVKFTTLLYGMRWLNSSVPLLHDVPQETDQPWERLVSYWTLALAQQTKTWKRSCGKHKDFLSSSRPRPTNSWPHKSCRIGFYPHIPALYSLRPARAMRRFPHCPSWQACWSNPFGLAKMPSLSTSTAACTQTHTTTALPVPQEGFEASSHSCCGQSASISISDSSTTNTFKHLNTAT